MSLKKRMSPWSGQELTSHKLPLPFPDPYGKEPSRPNTWSQGLTTPSQLSQTTQSSSKQVC